MHNNVDVDELMELSLERAFLTLSHSHDGLPRRLYAPAIALTHARDGRRNAEVRLQDLATMSRETEFIFRDVLSPMHVLGDEPVPVSPKWSIALSRWTELLHFHAGNLLVDDLLPELAERGFRILSVAEAAERHAAWIHAHFQDAIYPLLTPLAVDPGRPFPFISSDSLNLLVELGSGQAYETTALIARVKIPNITPRLIKLPRAPESASQHTGSVEPASYIWSLDLVRHYISELFVRLPIRQVNCFRVLRAPDAYASHYADPTGVRGRQARGSVVRVDVQSDMSPRLFNWLVDHLDVTSYSVVRYHHAGLSMSLPQLADAVHHWTHSA